MQKDCEDLNIFQGNTKRLHYFTISKTQDNRYCLICKDCKSNESFLLTPCSCSGYIHEKCLKTWMNSQRVEKSSIKCEICKTNYIMKYAMVQSHPIKKCFYDSCLHFIYLPMIFLVMVFCFYASYLLLREYFTIKSNEEERRFMIKNIIICGFSGFFLLILIISILIKFFAKPSVSKSHILSQYSSRDSIEEPENEEIENFMSAVEKIKNVKRKDLKLV